MEREDQFRAGRAPAVHPRPRGRGRLTAAAIAALGGLYATVAIPSANAQTLDLTVNKTTQIGTATYNNVIFNATQADVDLLQNAGTTLTLNQGGITKNGTNNSTLSGGTVLLGPNATQFRVVAAGGTLTIGSVLVTGGKGLVLDAKSVGTLVLNSTDAAEDLTGGISVDGGTLQISNDLNLGNRDRGSFVLLNGGTFDIRAKSSITLSNTRYIQSTTNGAKINIGDSASLSLLGSDQLRGTGVITKSGAGTLIIGGTNRAFGGSFNITAGDLELHEPGAILSRSVISLSGNAGLNLRSDLAAAQFGNSVTTPVGAAPGNVTVDYASISGKGGGHFTLGGLSAGGGTINFDNSTDDGTILHFAGTANIAATATLNTIGKSVVWLDGQLVGQGALTKDGGGILYIAGSTDNTNSSLTTVLGGELRLAKTSPGLLAITGDMLVNGGSVRLDTSNQIADTSTVNLTAGAFQVHSQAEQFSYFNNSGGALTTGVGGSLRLIGGAAGVPGAGLLAGPLPGPLPPSLVITGGSTTVNSGGLIDAFAVQISGGANTAEAGGVFSVGAGGLTFTGSASANLSLNSDAATPGQLQLAGPMTFSGAAGTASITSTGTGALPGAVDLRGATRDVTVGDGSAGVDLLITAGVTNGALHKMGAGTLRLEGANTLTGVTIDAGAVEVNNAAALGAAPITLNAGTLRVRADSAVTTFTGPVTAADSTLDVDRDTTSGGATGSVEFGALTIGAAHLTVVGGNGRSVRMTGPVALTGTPDFDTAAPLRLSGVVSGAFGVTKDGVGKLTFDGGAANTFSGTTRVNAGTLELNKAAGNAVPGALAIFGGTVRLLRPNQIADTADVTIQNAGSLLDLSGQTETVNSLNGAGGGVNLGTNGVLTVTRGNYSGVISGAGMLVQENTGGGTSAAVVLGNTQTFTGGVLVNHGSVTFSNQAPQHTGTTLAGGTWGVYNGSSLIFNAGSNITTNLASVTLSGATSAFGKINSLSDNRGSFTVTGGKTFATAGALANSGTIAVGPASQLTLTGNLTNSGTLTTTGTLAANAAINTGGALTVSGPQSHGPSASLNVTGGTSALNTDAGSTSAYNLAVTVTGGSLAFNATEHLRSLTVGAPVTLGPITKGPATAGPNVLVTPQFATTGSGQFDLANNALVVDYTGTPGPALTTVRSAIVSGFAGGAWTGPGIVSGAAAANPGYAVGYAEASAVFNISGSATALFRGQTVDATAVLARFTSAGDANLDGTVNFADLLALAKNYNRTGVDWNQGDFNYDRAVNFADLLALAKSYNRALAADPVPASPSPEFAADLALAIAEVPEPSGAVVALAATCAAALTTRRRRPQTC